VAKDFAWGPKEDGLRVLNVPFGEGVVPVTDYVKELRRLGISAPLSMHFEYPHPETGRRDWAVEQYGRDVGALRQALAPGSRLSS
jgi:sugar phosphate isomerase/epimerase